MSDNVAPEKRLPNEAASSFPTLDCSCSNEMGFHACSTPNFKLYCACNSRRRANEMGFWDGGIIRAEPRRRMPSARWTVDQYKTGELGSSGSIETNRNMFSGISRGAEPELPLGRQPQ
jgi:hypothetical protein